MTKFYVYMIRCSDDSLYTGMTNDIDKRMKRHASGRGSKYVRTRLPFKLIFKQEVPTKSDALKRERQIKALRRSAKEELITSEYNLLIKS